MKVFEQFRSRVEPGMLEEIRLFLGVEEGVSDYSVGEDKYQKIYIHIFLEKFSYVLAKNIFLHLFNIIVLHGSSAGISKNPKTRVS